MQSEGDVWSSIVDMAICGSCGELVRRENMVERSHMFAGALIVQRVCNARCAYEEPCPATFSGVHGEIEDLDDLSEWPMSELELPWWLFETKIDRNQYGRIGRCALCKDWQVWNVEVQGWRDPDLIW